MECCTYNGFQADLLFHLARYMESSQEVRFYLKGRYSAVGKSHHGSKPDSR
nr:MAG TPA: hypothetical protein [Caudoviricetes sp.]